MDQIAPMQSPEHYYSQRLTQRQKEANDKAWYKHFAILYSGRASYGINSSFISEIDEKRQMQAYYDLYNNIIDPSDFKYITKPFGDNVGELPADFSNKDISSINIKTMLGIEMKRPFAWQVIATNKEATNRKEQFQFGQIKEFVQAQIMMPIQEQLEQQAFEQMQGRQPSQEEIAEIQQQVAQELERMTPDEVHKYMAREHQDPAEVMMRQLLEYYLLYTDVQRKENEMFKHLCISAYDVGYCGIVNGKPYMDIVNPMNFYHDKSPDVQFVEDGEWAVCMYYMTPSQCVTFFNDSPEGLSNAEIDDIYRTNYNMSGSLPQSLFRFDGTVTRYNTLPVAHVVWKSLRKIGFLTFMDEQGFEQQSIVDESYKLRPEIGDINLEWEWVPEVHETYNVANKFFKKMRPVKGQFKDMNNMYESKLPYIGAVMDSTNSDPVSPMGRMAHWQFLYNICMFRIEQLMASDKGKKTFMNINMIPTGSGQGNAAGVDMNKFLYYMDALNIGFVNPNEEGNRDGDKDISRSIKEVDMSLVSDIQKYIMLAEYIEKRCGLANGITEAMRGMAAPSEAVTNNQMNQQQSSYIIEPIFNLHNLCKRNRLTYMLKLAQVAHAGQEGIMRLNYTLDDLSQQLLQIDLGLLDASTFGLFVANSSKMWEAKQAVDQLSHAAMQNNKAELSDVIRVMTANSVQEAQEILSVAEIKAQKREQELIAMQQEELRKTQEQEQAFEAQKHEWEIEKIVTKERERRETELQKQAMLSIGFNVDKDMDKDGVLDVMEVYKKGIDADIKIKKQALDEAKHTHQVQQDGERNKIEREKIAVQKAKRSVASKVAHT
jgi:hypothetical protein